MWTWWLPSLYFRMHEDYLKATAAFSAVQGQEGSASTFGSWVMGPWRPAEAPGKKGEF